MEFGWRYVIWYLISVIILSEFGDFLGTYFSERLKEIFFMKMVYGPIIVIVVFSLEIIYQLVKFIYKDINENKEKNDFMKK